MPHNLNLPSYQLRALRKTVSVEVSALETRSQSHCMFRMQDTCQADTCTGYIEGL